MATLERRPLGVIPRPYRLTAAALLACAGTAGAHDTWIAPARFFSERGTAVRIDMSSGMSFPGLGNGIRPERVRQARIRLGGREEALPPPQFASSALRFSTPLAADGVATVWIQLAPKALVLTPALVEEYLKEIGATQSIGPRWHSRPDPKKWRETYSKHAKTFVRVGDPASDTSWREPVGLRLELIPEADPTSLRTGDSLSLILRKDGVARPGLAVGADRGGAGGRRLATADAEGRVTFSLDRPGPWLFSATDLREAGSDWESDFTTLTLEVRPPAR